MTDNYLEQRLKLIEDEIMLIHKHHTMLVAMFEKQQKLNANFILMIADMAKALSGGNSPFQPEDLEMLKKGIDI